jgi:hypothetical protein
MGGVVEEYLLFCLLSLLKIIVACKEVLFNQYHIFYEGSHSFKLTADVVKYLYYLIFTNFTYYRVEPSFDNWVCMCFMHLDKTRNCYYYSEKYKVLDKGLTDEELDESVNHFLDKNILTIYENVNIKESMLIVKYNGLYYVNPLTETYTKKLSKVRFLSIEYVCGNSRIEIVLPKEMYVVGNELFSPLFVLRCLKYQEKDFIFDKNYNLFIMDGDLNNIGLTSDFSINLEERKYTIKNMTE